MRNVVDYAIECMDKLDRIGVPYGNIIDITVNSRATRRFGQCRRLPSGDYAINISDVLLDERNDDLLLIDTVFHEILHTAPDCMNHGKEWKRLVDIVNRNYGTHISRTASSACLAAPKEVFYKYEFVCKECGQRVRRQRESNFVKYYTSYTCGRCGGHFQKV